MFETESLMLEMLRAIRAEIAGVRADLKENTARLGRVEASLVGLRRDFAHSEEG